MYMYVTYFVGVLGNEDTQLLPQLVLWLTFSRNKLVLKERSSSCNKQAHVQCITKHRSMYAQYM